jgi:hypothetical protein
MAQPGVRHICHRRMAFSRLYDFWLSYAFLLDAEAVGRVYLGAV